jgi:signal transduction histidine kinase
MSRRHLATTGFQSQPPDVNAATLFNAGASQSREHATHLEILAEASKAFAEAGLDFQRLLDTITRQIGNLDVDLCVIRLLSDDSRTLIPMAYYHPDEAARELLSGIMSVPQGAAEGLNGRVVQSGEPLLMPVVSPAEIRRLVPGRHWSEYLDRFGIHSVLIVPLRARSRVIGALAVFRGTEGHPYTLADQILVQDLADRAALAVDNARLYDDVLERERRLQDLVGRILAAQEEERRRVAYDVHDGLAQVAASAHQHLQAFAVHGQSLSSGAREELSHCLSLSRRTIREARRVIANLRPTTLDDFGLAAAVRLQVEELNAEGWDVSFIENLGDQRLFAPLETALFRVIQEAMTNVRKHAGTTCASIALERGTDSVRLEVRDRGRGFDSTELGMGSTAGEHVGLPGMRERISLLGGTFQITSSPGVGTAVIAIVPMATQRSGESHRD